MRHPRAPFWARLAVALIASFPITSTVAEEAGPIYGKLELFRPHVLELRVDGRDYRLSGTTAIRWQNGARATQQSLQPGMQVELHVAPARDASQPPLVRTLVLQLE
jgi:hypothetical protein